MSVSANGKTQDSYHMLLKLKFALAIGLFFVLIYSLRFWRTPGMLALILGVGVLGAGASLFSGFLVGFIFGIPRTIRSETPNSSPAPPAAGSTPGSTTATAPPTPNQPTSKVEPNSNLVEISDWLTKIIVGVGLVELGKIPTKMEALAAYFARGLRDCTSESCIQASEAFAMSIIVFYAACGFLIAYLWARIYLEKEFSELGAIKEQVSMATTWIFIVLARVLTGLGTWLNPKPAQIDSASFRLAISSLRRGIAKYPKAGELHRELGFVLKAFGTRETPMDTSVVEDALSHALEAASLNPNDAYALYNAACYQALLKKDPATIVKNLKRAFELQPSLRSTAVDDPDLAGMKGDPGFQALVSGSGSSGGD